MRAAQAAYDGLGEGGGRRDRSAVANEFGDLHLALGDGDNAKRLYEEALRIARELVRLQPEHAEWKRDVSVSCSKLGDLHRALGEGDNAKRLYEEARRIARELVRLQPEHAEWKRDVSVSCERLGDLHIALGDLETARSFYEEDLRIARELVLLQPEHADWKRDVSVSCNMLGDLHIALGEGDAAKRLYEEALRIARELVLLQPERIDWQRDLAISYERLAAVTDGEEGVRWLEASLALRRALAPRVVGDVVAARELAIVLVQLGARLGCPAGDGSLAEGRDLLVGLNRRGALEAQFVPLADALAADLRSLFES